MLSKRGVNELSRWKLQGDDCEGVLPALLVDYLVVAGGGGGHYLAGNGGGGMQVDSIGCHPLSISNYELGRWSTTWSQFCI